MGDEVQALAADEGQPWVARWLYVQPQVAGVLQVQLGLAKWPLQGVLPLWVAILPWEVAIENGVCSLPLSQVAGWL